MHPTLSDFQVKFPDKRYSFILNIPCFNFLTDPQIISHMLFNTFNGNPALDDGLAELLMRRFKNCPVFPLDDAANRTCVGKMIRYILDIYGLSPVSVGKIKGSKCEFKRCAVYQ